MNNGKRPRLLDMFCGAGGASVGYARAGFDVVGVDIRPQPRYPFEFHQADALAFLADHGTEFDVFHASPPCQRYSVVTPTERRQMHPDLIGAVQTALDSTFRPFVIENVSGARHLLREPIMLCGSMFGLQVWRHRYFEIRGLGPTLWLQSPCNHSNVPVLVTGRVRRRGHKAEASMALKRAAMGIDWMSQRELDEAIPPAYTEYIGNHLLLACAGA